MTAEQPTPKTIPAETDRTAKPKRTGRIRYLDVLRSIAIISITMNHAVNRSFETSANTLQEFLTLPLYMTVIKACIYIFSRLGVPLFLMITGILLLDRDYSDPQVLRRFLKHNLLSLFVTTEIWLCIMYWYLKLPSIVMGNFSVWGLFKGFVLNQLFLNQTTMGSMWYMPMIFCVYLLIPVISLAIHKVSAKLVAVIAAFTLVLTVVIPNVNVILIVAGSEFQLEPAFEYSYLLSYYWVYVIIGYFIGKGVLQKWNTSVVWAAFFASFALTVLFQIWMYASPYDYAVVYGDIGPMVSAAFLAEAVRRQKISSLVGITSRKLSRVAFGVYFVHICIMTGLQWVISDEMLYYLPRFFVLELVSFFGSLMIIAIVSKFKWCRKYLFLMK